MFAVDDSTVYIFSRHFQKFVRKRRSFLTHFIFSKTFENAYRKKMSLKILCQTLDALKKKILVDSRYSISTWN